MKRSTRSEAYRPKTSISSCDSARRPGPMRSWAMVAAINNPLLLLGSTLSTESTKFLRFFKDLLPLRELAEVRRGSDRLVHAPRARRRRRFRARGPGHDERRLPSEVRYCSESETISILTLVEPGRPRMSLSSAMNLLASWPHWSNRRSAALRWRFAISKPVDKLPITSAMAAALNATAARLRRRI